MAQLRALVDKLLTNVSIGYFPDGYICENIFPELPVDQQSGLLGSYGNQHLRTQRSQAGGRGEAPRVNAIKRVTTGNSYLIEDHALEDIITPSDRRNVELPFNLEQDLVLGLTAMMYLEKEAKAATLLSDTATLTQNTTLVGTSQFNDYMNSDPISQFVTAQKAVRAGCGLPPDTAIMDWSVYQVLRYHPQLFDRLGFKYNQVNPLTADNVAAAMDVQQLLIAKPVYNNSVEGQSDNLVQVWGKGIVFAVLPKTAQPRQVSLGYYLHYRNMKARQVYRYPIYNPANSEGFQVLDNYQYKVTNANAGYLIASAIA